jgi:hypothetical protein
MFETSEQGELLVVACREAFLLVGFFVLRQVVAVDRAVVVRDDEYMAHE